MLLKKYTKSEPALFKQLGLMNQDALSEIVFQEQSYSHLHSASGQSLAWDHFRGDIDDPCGIVADFCRVIADPCGVVAIPDC